MTTQTASPELLKKVQSNFIGLDTVYT
ncbi:uncharacterized protein METZ01_LOCUS452461, partial [marine metagenome]